MSTAIESIQPALDSFDSENQQSKILEFAFNHCPYLIAYCDVDLCYRFVNRPYADFFGYSADELVGKSIEDLFEKKRFQASLHYLQKVLAGEVVCFQTNISYQVNSPGRYEVRYIPEFDRNNTVSGFYAFISNIDDSIRVKEAHELLRYAVDQGMEGLSIHNKEGEFIYVNPAEAEMYGYEVDEVLGQTYHLFYDDEELELIENQYFAKLMEDGKWRGTLNARRKDGSHFSSEVSLTILRDSNDEFDGLICTCRDITDKKHAMDQLSYLAHYDHLTGLSNRLLFKDNLNQLISQANRRNEMIAIFFLDLDDFKHINDTLGHTIGDQLIITVAERLKSLFRKEDILARFSGDEFTIAVGGITDHYDAINLATKITEEFNHPILLKGLQVVQKTSIGISIYPNDGEDMETLIKNADTAMYRAKDDGLHGYRFYSSEMSKRAANYLRLSSELHQAVDAKEFELHYQPFINLATNAIGGFEALVRWQHPQQGLIYPDHFIPYAEKSGLITTIDRQVLNKSCRQASKWMSNGYQFDQISVNISGVELQEGFVEVVEAILQESQLAPECLKLEVTETFLMTQMKRPIEILKRIRELGVYVAIDDFGVGYSSLTRLKRLPVTCLKIDRSFVSEIDQDYTDQSIVEAIIALSNSLNLGVIAEGVETEDQLNILKQLGAHYAQGYYISRPTPATNVDEVYAFIETL